MDSENILMPTKKGISLNLQRWLRFTTSVDAINSTIKKRSETSVHLGGNVYVSKQSNSICVDLRCWWRPTDSQELKPTRKGITLRPAEFRLLIESIEKINSYLPELNIITPCYMQGDHQNQLGALWCKECTPDGLLYEISNTIQ